MFKRLILAIYSHIIGHSIKGSTLSKGKSFKKHIYLGVMLSVMAMPSLTQAEATDQAKWVGDVPIMPELTIKQGLGFAFDNPEGRIVTIYLSGNAPHEDIVAYYDQALLPLGWKKKNNQEWHRRDESLTLLKTASAGTGLWKIMLRPE